MIQIPLSSFIGRYFFIHNNITYVKCSHYVILCVDPYKNIINLFVYYQLLRYFSIIQAGSSFVSNNAFYIIKKSCLSPIIVSKNLVTLRWWKKKKLITGFIALIIISFENQHSTWSTLVKYCKKAHKDINNRKIGI